MDRLRNKVLELAMRGKKAEKGGSIHQSLITFPTTKLGRISESFLKNLFPLGIITLAPSCPCLPSSAPCSQYFLYSLVKSQHLFLLRCGSELVCSSVRAGVLKKTCSFQRTKWRFHSGLLVGRTHKTGAIRQSGQGDIWKSSGSPKSLLVGRHCSVYQESSPRSFKNLFPISHFPIFKRQSNMIQQKK